MTTILKSGIALAFAGAIACFSYAATAQEVRPPAEAASQITVPADKDYVSPATQALLDRRAALRMESRDLNKQLRALGR